MRRAAVAVLVLVALYVFRSQSSYGDSWLGTLLGAGLILVTGGLVLAGLARWRRGDGPE